MVESNTLLQLNNVSMRFDQKQVLKDVCLKVGHRDFLGVIGPNGGGKTTLMRIILGLLKPTSGAIQYFNNGKEIKELNIGYLPQYTSIDRKFPISIYDVILSGLNKERRLWKPFTQEHHERTTHVMERLGLNGMGEQPIGALSGGQLQRVLLARAIVSQPQLLILDEPNTYLDKRYETQLYQILEELNKECAIIMVSHDIGTILQNVKQVACVNVMVDYHPCNEVSESWLEQNLHCPFELLGHGDLPHRILGHHHHPSSNE